MWTSGGCNAAADWFQELALDSALPLVLSNTPTACEVRRMSGCWENQRTDRHSAVIPVRQQRLKKRFMPDFKIGASDFLSVASICHKFSFWCEIHITALMSQQHHRTTLAHFFRRVWCRVFGLFRCVYAGEALFRFTQEGDVFYV